MKSNSLKNITQTTSEAERTLFINLSELELYKFDLGIEENGVATGVVEIWVKDVTSINFEKVASVDLTTISGKDYTPLRGPFDAFRVVPVGVTGSFNFSCVAY